MSQQIPNCCTHTPLLTSTKATQNPLYDISKFCPAGTISVPLIPDYKANANPHFSEFWHVLPEIAQLISFVHDDVSLRSLHFLSRHNFIRATCRFEYTNWSSKLIIRIYMIPFDLANVQGQLRIRDEASILAPARRYLRSLLPRIVQDHDEWFARETLPPSHDREFFHKPSMDDRTMAEIYSSLSSPSGNSDLRLAKKVLAGDLQSLRSTLHPYQRRSIVAMLDKELTPHSDPDPLYVPIYSIDGTKFYIQPATLELLSERPFVEQARGGILCEELGTGKTVIALGLVVATIDQLSTPEESYNETPPVMTPMSLESFPFATCNAVRQRLHRAIKFNPVKDEGNDKLRLPSLREILLHSMRVRPEGIDIDERQTILEERGLLPAYEKNVPFYLHYNEEPFDAPRSRRHRVEPKPRIVYLTTATLIVVPANLLYQWEMEILKHCDDSLRVLVVKTTKPLPPASELASLYDVILMSHLRFSAEAGKDQLKKLHVWKSCKCPKVPNPHVSVTSCQCHHHADVSPLFQVRWKRMILDEGHVASNSTTDLVTLTKKLSIERRWIVTGTPTTNLMGLHFGGASEQQSSEDEVSEALRPDPRSSSDSEDDDRCSRIWTSADRQDLNKLAHMMIDFLRIPQFVADHKRISNHVIAPLMSSSGPQPGAIEALTQLMQSVMVRHRIVDVEKEILLPTLIHDTVLLDLDPYAVKTYNIMQAIIAINAIDSERTGQDYLFHPGNAVHLQRIIENMSQAMFWHTDDKYFNLDEIMKSKEGYLQRASQRGSPELQLLESALHQFYSAVSDPVWKALMNHPNVFQRATGMPQAIYEAWNPLPDAVSLVSDSCTAGSYYLCHPEQLAKVYATVCREPLLHEYELVQTGYRIRRAEQLRHWHNVSRLRAGKAGKHPNDAIDRMTKLKEYDVMSPEKLKQIQRDLAEEQEIIKATAEGDPSAGHRPTPMTAISSRLFYISPLAKVRLGNTTSSKLNYIINDILLYGKTEKFLIFSKSPLTLAYISEALEVIQVKHLHFTSKVDLKTREQYVTTFETSDTYRVFLMELKHGARGLNLVSASRVIFCEPVWQADVETQAIKRVHRIGQTRPVTVKTLAIRDTYEEIMMSRRAALRNGSSKGKLPNFTDDRTMRDFLANPTFLPDPPAPDIFLNIAFLGEQAAAKAGHIPLALRPTRAPVTLKKPREWLTPASEYDPVCQVGQGSSSSSPSVSSPLGQEHPSPDHPVATTSSIPTLKIKRVRLILPPRPPKRASSDDSIEEDDTRQRKKRKLVVRFAM